MRLALTVSVNDVTYTRNHDYKCVSSRMLSSATGKIEGNFNAPRVDGFLELNAGDILYYSFTGECWVKDSTKSSQVGYLALLRSSVSPPRLYRLGRQDEQLTDPKISILSVVNSPIDGPLAQEPELSSSVKSTLQSFVLEMAGWQQVVARTYPKELWNKVPELAKHFNVLTEITLAQPLSTEPKTCRNNGGYARRAFACQNNIFQDGWRKHMVEVRFQKHLGQWFYPSDLSEFNSGLYPSYLEELSSGTLVNYKGVVFKLDGYQALFDPETKSLVEFHSVTVPQPWNK